MYWFTLSWWKYLLEDLDFNISYDRGISPLKVILCRIRGHKCGVIWYSGRYEPDMSCKNCGDDLG